MNSVNNHNFQKARLPQQLATGGTLAVGVAREFRFTPAPATFPTDASVLIYSLGEVARNGGPHVYRARISNKTNADIAAGGIATLNITGANTIGPVNLVLPVITSGQTIVVDFPGQTFVGLGPQTATVTIPTDAFAADNTSSYTQNVTEYGFSYGTPSQTNAGGVGFNGGANPAYVGEFVARFRNTSGTAKTVNQARVDFQAYIPANGQVPYRILVFAANGLDNLGNTGAPGTLLFASDTLLTPVLASTAIIPILPTGLDGLSIAANSDFFIGVRQLGPKNVGFSFETESPLRDKAFYTRANATGNPTNPFTDQASYGGNFRFVIGADLLDPTPAVPNCVVLTSPANLAVNVPTRGINGRIAFTSGGGAPTGFDVYLSTSLADVTSGTASMGNPNPLVSPDQQSIVFRFAPLNLLYNVTYYYKVVARNQNGDVSGPLSVGGSCTNTIYSFTTQDGPPLNNDCSSSLALTVGAASPANQTTKGADEDVVPGLFDPACVSGDLRDVWYTFNSGSSTVLNLTLTPDAGPTGASALGAALYPNSCGATELMCYANAVGTRPLTGLTMNTFYRIRVWTIVPGQTPGRFSITLNTPPNLAVNSAVSNGGAYNNLVINNGGTLTMTSNIQANNLTIHDGGTLITGGFVASGNVFILEAGGTLEASSADGITRTGAPGANTGSIVFTSRSYSNDATYRFAPVGSGVTGNGLPTTVRGIGTVNGSGFTTLTRPVNVTEMVRMGDANLLVGGSRSAPGITLLSNAAKTAMVVNTAATGNVVGTAQVFRYISPALTTLTNYHHLSSPVIGAPFSDMSTGGVAGFQVRVNALYNDPMTRSGLSFGQFPNVFFFDGSAAALANSFVEGYQSPNAASDLMQPGVGYSVFTKPVTTDFIGTLQQGAGATRSVLAQVTRDGNTDFGNGWNMIGNPYASPIDWDLVPAADLTAAGLASAIYVWKGNGFDVNTRVVSGSYSPYTNGVGPTGVELLAMGQAFFVQKTLAPGATFSFKNVERLTQPANPQLNRRVETRPLVELSLLQSGQAAQMADHTYVYFQQGARTSGNDNRFDAHKLPSTGNMPMLYTRAGNELMSINGLPALTSSVTVPLAAEVTVTGTYVLNADRAINMPAGMQVFLVDALTGTTQNLSVNPSYSFQATAGNTTPRFTLQFRSNGVTGVSADQSLTNQLSVYPNPVSNQAVRVMLGGLTDARTVAVTLLSPLGQVVARQEVAVANGAISTELDVRSLAKGIYTLRVVAEGRMVTRAVVVQ